MFFILFTDNTTTMSIAPSNEPKSKLGYYRLLAPNCGVRVSPLCLGGMNFGTAWRQLFGDMDKESAFKMLDFYYENGGNFIDTASNYQDGESETWIGEWMAKRGVRDQMVIATKYSFNYKRQEMPGTNCVNFTGNSRKCMHMSVKESLKKLQTDYIDILYVHVWDHTTPIEEIMQGLNQLVAKGKVTYLGISNTPAWNVAKANQYARDHGLSPFVVYQGRWSLASRELEREIIPMCKAEGMGITPFKVLGGGFFKTDEEAAKLKETGEAGRKEVVPGTIDKNKPIVKVLEKMAKEKNSTVTGIALAYVLAKTPYVFPIVGGRKLEHLKGSIEAMEKVHLSPEDIKELEDASPIDLGFPHDVIGQSPAQNMTINLAAKYSWVQSPSAIQFI